MNLILGDCLTELRNIPDDSIDSIVTDPPAAISFMNKKWDHDRGGRDNWIAWLQSVADECLRVLKPGAHALVWTLPRTSHWTAMAFENAGFEVRDKIVHIFAQGFPKSLNVSAAIDKKLGATREVIGPYKYDNRRIEGSGPDSGDNCYGQYGRAPTGETAPATPEAQRMNGFGTALKPAHEDWLLLRKPLIGTVVDNVLTHGTGALNIDACRVGVDTIPVNRYTPGHDMTSFHGSRSGEDYVSSQHTGRFPANLTHDGSDEVLALFPQSDSQRNPRPSSDVGGGIWAKSNGKPVRGDIGDTGSVARFFYCAPQDEFDLLFCRAKSIIEVLNITIGGEQCNLRNASIAEPSLSLSNQTVASVLSDAVILVSRGAMRLSDLMGLSMIVTANELETLLTSLITAILSIENGVLLEPPPGKPIPNGTLVSIAEIKKPTDITTIMISRWKSDGFVEPVTLSITPNNMAVGGADLPSRFKYCAKASKRDRDEGLDDFDEVRCGAMEANVDNGDFLTGGGNQRQHTAKNFHPTVKSTELMRWLVRLVTPPSGTVLDPFAGSGSTGKAAILEGFDFIGIELDPDYYEIAKRRIAFAQSQVDTQLQLPLNMEIK